VVTTQGIIYNIITVLKTIVKNSSYLLISQLLVKVFAFGYAIFLAGNIGATDFGLYSAALSIFGLMSLFSDLGINRVLTRDIARDESELPKLFSTALLLRAFSAAASFLVLAVFFFITDPSETRFTLTTIALLSLVPQSVALSIDAILIALKKASFSAFGFFLFNMVSFIIGAILIYQGFGVYGAITAFLIGQVTYAVILICLLSSSRKINFAPFDFKIAKNLLLKSWPYGIIAALGFASFRIDTVILSYTRSGEEAGIYALAYRFLEAATIIPVAFGTVLYPIFSQHNADPAKTKKLFNISLLYGAIGGFIVVLIMNTVVPVFLNVFMPESFSGSSLALVVLSFALPFLFMHIPLSQLILSKESFLRQIVLLYILIFAVNLMIMLLVIPVYGFMGAAVVTVISEATTFLGFWIFIKKRLRL
jgi:O-antigen/teichoic acid export membrane protein